MPTAAEMARAYSTSQLRAYITAYRAAPISTQEFCRQINMSHAFISSNVTRQTAAYNNLSEREKAELEIIITGNNKRAARGRSALHSGLISSAEVQRRVAERMGEAQAAEGAGVAGPSTVASSAALAVPGTSVSYPDDERFRIGAEAWAARFYRGGLGDALGVSSETRDSERKAFACLAPELQKKWIDYAVEQCMARTESSYVSAGVVSVPAQSSSQRIR